eukprot:1757025-Prymnesium_polylepis.1
MARSQLEGMLPTPSATARKVYSLRHKVPPHSEARRSQPGTAVTPLDCCVKRREITLARGVRERRRHGPVRCRPALPCEITKSALRSRRSLRFEAGAHEAGA